MHRVVSQRGRTPAPADCVEVVAAPDEELQAPARLPRSITWALAAAIIVIVAVKVSPGVSRTMAQPSSAVLATPPLGRSPSPTPVVAQDVRRVSLPHPNPPDAIVADDRYLLTLLGNRVVRSSDNGAVLAAVVPGLTDRRHPDARLVLDREARELWVVVPGSRTSLIASYTFPALTALTSLRLPARTGAAAALRGNLYLADPVEIERIGLDGDNTPIVLPPGETVVDMAADPSRTRIMLLTHAGAGLRLTELGANATVSRAVPHQLRNGRLAVTEAGQIWLSGFGARGAVLLRLDPVTLQTVATSPLTGRLGPGAVLLSVGARSLLVAPGDGRREIWCADDQAGAPMQTWRLAPQLGAIAPSVAYVEVDAGVDRLTLAGSCTG